MLPSIIYVDIHGVKKTTDFSKKKDLETAFEYDVIGN